jgi:hypothetical protein
MQRQEENEQQHRHADDTLAGDPSFKARTHHGLNLAKGSIIVKKSRTPAITRLS